MDLLVKPVAPTGPNGNGAPTLRKGDCGHWLPSASSQSGVDDEGRPLYLCSRCYQPSERPTTSDDEMSHVLRKGYLPQDLRSAVAAGPHVLQPLRFPLGEIDNYSVSRHARALMLLRSGHSHSVFSQVAPWESKYLAALGDLEMKAQGEAVSIQDGAALSPEYWTSQWSDLLRAFSPINQLPVTRLMVPYRIAHLPKVTVDITVSYPGENTAPAQTQFSFGQVTYTARKADTVIGVSNELMRDAPFLADQVLRRSSAGAIALDRDTQILLGQGGSNPTGLVTMATAGTINKYYPGATASTAISATPGHAIPSFFHVSTLRGKIHRLNGSTNAPATGQAHCNGMIVHSRFEQDVLTQGTASGPWTDANGRPLWMTGLSNSATRADEDHAADGALLGQVWALTNILPTNSTDGGGTASSFVIAGWWQQYVLFESLQLAYDVTMDDAFFQKDETGVRVVHRWDGVPAHPESFAALAGCDSVTP